MDDLVEEKNSMQAADLRAGDYFIEETSKDYIWKLFKPYSYYMQTIDTTMVTARRVMIKLNDEWIINVGEIERMNPYTKVKRVKLNYICQDE